MSQGRSTPARVLMLGIDAADPALLRAWATDGTLPNVARLLRTGLSGDTQSVEGFFVGSTWPSLYTGVNPARHGLHYLTQLKPGTYETYQPAREAFVKHPPFWSLLSRAGKRVAIIDVPLTKLDPSINGLQIVDWGGHDAVFGYQAWPPDLDVKLPPGGPDGHLCDAYRTGAAEYERFVEHLIHRVESRAELTRNLLRRGDWDLFIQVFSESHCAGHQCWHLHDVLLPTHDAAVAAVTGDPIRRVYQAIDSAIGRILEEAGDGLVLLISAHGMSHWFGACFLLPRILIRLGITVPNPPPPSSVERPYAWRTVARRIWRRLPASLKTRLAPLRQRLSGERLDPLAVKPLGVDAAKSLCFAVQNGLATGGIRLNLKGREPHGLVAPGAEADALCERIMASLLAIVDQKTGQPIVARVRRTADLYQGEHLGDLPDLLVDWNDRTPVGSAHVNGGAAASVTIQSPEIGVMEGTNDFSRTGEHRIGGIFIAAGPGIRPGTMNRTISNLDLAPTIARVLGVELPGVDGRPILELESAVLP